jgi:hypothetical protein
MFKYLNMKIKYIHVFKDGKMDELELKKNNINEINKIISKNCKSQGANDIKLLYKWYYENNYISCYGWYEGELGFKNKHDLPPGGISSFLDEDSSEKKLYGDILLIKSDKFNKIIDFNISEYSVFYNHIFDTYDNYNSDNNYDSDNNSDDNINISDDNFNKSNSNNDNITDDEYEILDISDDDDDDDDIDNINNIDNKLINKLNYDNTNYK